jgi:hypothetical protein
MKLGLPLTTREKELADLKSTPSKRTYDVHFQGKMRTFPVHCIRLELPKYRLENGRTSAAQQDYIAKNKLPKNFFDASRSENSEVQRAQHAILKEMVESQDPEKNLMKFFKKRDQEQPLILDHAGFVVNGNRRLCAYREINENVDKTKFGHVDVIVLPKCDPKDIDELEAHLQVERDIKQDYSWISLALTLRQKLDSGQYTEDELRSIYDLDKKDIQGRITQLTLAEEYLASRNKVGRYLELEKTQFAFDQLQRNRAKLANSPGKQQLFSEIAFRLIESPEGDRLYASIPDAKDVLDDICSALETELFGSKIAAYQKQIEKTQTNDLFGKTEGAAQESKYIATFKALRESKEEQATNAIIQNAIEAKKERDRAIRRGNSALEAIRKANTAMADAVSLLSAQTTKTGIAEQIKAIEQSIEKIRKWLKK